MKIHHYNNKGQPCDKFGRVIHPEVLQDGEAINVSVLLMDGTSIEDADPYQDAAWFGDDYQPDRPPQRTADAVALDDHAAEAEAAYDEYNDWLHQAA